ncbi:MAG TPA: DUF3800 domain-containing protein [Candidatus Fournierella pullicola]|uniref:DUF3800 domain-containing protein n=1 Tax=Candidatus Allofournierella pullicola TaxID=2838596 RepID=A0A9D1V449_9FIRM|nr:DUF3800 domain-containing protein [Gemmiger formicilis]MBM6916843.1 DUF3800 domain-containing protein [Gemmiger formicilis]HIX05731.1 DUF3800 domain-containing protein [Candidatus Fournierella pullicola]
MSYYQLSMEDIENQKILQAVSDRTAYIDEYGSFGFDFSSTGASKYYILCAVIVENKDIDKLHSAVAEVKKNNGFDKAELKSSKIGNDYKRRNRILSQLLMINFRVILFIADKQAFIQGSPLTEYKKSFIKFLHQRLYNLLYHVYPKLKIIEDEIGTTEFQASFREYVQNNRPQMNLLNEYDFDYVDSKDELLVQLADMIGGSIGHSLNDGSAPNYLEMLKGKIIARDDFPNKTEPYWGTANPADYKYSKDVFTLAVKCASDFITKHENDTTDDRRAQVAFLQYLLFQVKNVSPTHYISSNQLVAVIREYLNHRITKNYLFRRVIAPLRDDGVIIASCSHGYKIPISVKDITTYLNQTHTIVSPMLHRVEVCRNLVLENTYGNFDILDDPAFIRYKKYFD